MDARKPAHKPGAINEPGETIVIHKTKLALIAALAITGAMSSAFAQTSHRNEMTGPHRLYNYADRDSTFRGNNNPAPVPYAPNFTGGGSLGYNQHNEIRN